MWWVVEIFSNGNASKSKTAGYDKGVCFVPITYLVPKRESRHILYRYIWAVDCRLRFQGESKNRVTRYSYRYSLLPYIRSVRSRSCISRFSKLEIYEISVCHLFRNVPHKDVPCTTEQYCSINLLTISISVISHFKERQGS